MQKKVQKLKSKKPDIPRLIDVAAYARVSCEKEAMLHSLSNQVSYYSSLIQSRRDWRFAGVFVDEGITGTKASRPDFQRMLEACRAGKIQMIITKSISRFARNTVDLLITVRELKQLGVNVFFEEQNIHSMSGDGELMLTILASFAQEESRSVSENCKWRIRKDYKAGIAKACAVYGYRIKGNVHHIVEAEAKIIRMIYADCLSGMGKEAIVKKLNEMNVPTRLGGQWADHTVREILRNERYIGDLLLQKTHVQDHLTKRTRKNKDDLPQYYIENNHPAIIDRETFATVQEEMARRAERFGAEEYACREYPFTGKMVCGKCGQHYRRKITSAGSKYAKPVWICATFNRLGRSHCASQQVPEDILMDAARQALGLSEFDDRVFGEQIQQIRVPEANLLIFVFRDGHEAKIPWEHQSRKWSDDAKQQARERYYTNKERGVTP